MLWRSWEESYPIVVKGLFISTCYRPLSVGLLYNNGTGKAVECKVIDVGLYLALLQIGAWKEVAIPPFHLHYPAITQGSRGQSADQDFLRHPILTWCQSAQKTSWQERINRVFTTYKSICHWMKWMYARQLNTMLSPPSCLYPSLFFLSCLGALLGEKRYRLITTAFFPFSKEDNLSPQIVCPSLSLFLTGFLFLLPLGWSGQALRLWPQEAANSLENGRCLMGRHTGPPPTHSPPQNDPWPIHVFISDHGSEK